MTMKAKITTASADTCHEISYQYKLACRLNALLAAVVIQLRQTARHVIERRNWP